MTRPDKSPNAISPGFETDLLSVPIASILPVKQLPVTVPKSQKYAQITASIREVGLIEPPVISRTKGQSDTFILLDGHVRLLVLKELGERLMAQQNILMENWSLDAGDLSNLEAEIEMLLFETIRVTRQTKAGAWIMRSMHATPVLAGVRVESHRHVARLLAERIIKTRPDLDHGRILPSARLSVEIGYAVVEMVFDEPSIDEGEILRQTASMLAFSLRQAMSHQA